MLTTNFYSGIVLLPFYLISFMFKIGNLSNDGYKLGEKTINNNTMG